MYRKEITTYIFSILFIAMAAAIQIMEARGTLPFTGKTLVFFLYALVFLLWAKNMENRVLRADVARRFKLIALMLVGYLATRTVKYEILIGSSDAVRWIRYIYYFFILTTVHLVFSTSLYVGKSERDAIDKRWNLFWIPTAALILLIMTNDLHGLVFVPYAHASGFKQYGPVYLLTNGYILLLAALTLIITSKRSLAQKRLKSIAAPVAVLAVCFLYTMLYIADWPAFHYVKIAFQSAEFNSLTVILFIESLVFTRLIASNRGYDTFLSLSSLNLGMMDLNGQIVVKPNKGPEVSTDAIKDAENRAIAVDENTLLESSSIGGGCCFWFVDLTDFNRLKAQLLSVNEEMLNENELLLANNKLKKEMAMVEEQRDIRDAIQEKLKPQFAQLKVIMAHLPEAEDAYEDALKDACLLNVYIKRFSNLFLLARNKADLSLAEMRLAFDESLDYLRLKGVVASNTWAVDGEADATLGLSLYAAFQIILEAYLHSLEAIFVHFKEIEEGLLLTIYVESREKISLARNFRDALPSDGVSFTETFEENLCLWRFSVKKGGDPQ